MKGIAFVTAFENPKNIRLCEVLTAKKRNSKELPVYFE